MYATYTNDDTGRFFTFVPAINLPMHPRSAAAMPHNASDWLVPGTLPDWPEHDEE